MHLLGNVVIWYTGTLSLAVYAALQVFYLLRRRRQCFDVPEETYDQFVDAGFVLVGGYLFHYVPFFFADRTLFLHHYLPAYIFKLMVCAFVVGHVHGLASSWSRLAAAAFRAAVCLWLVAAFVVFCRFAALSYGVEPLTAEQVQMLRWKDTWDLIVHKP